MHGLDDVPVGMQERGVVVRRGLAEPGVPLLSYPASTPAAWNVSTASRVRARNAKCRGGVGGTPRPMLSAPELDVLRRFRAEREAERRQHVAVEALAHVEIAQVDVDVVEHARLSFSLCPTWRSAPPRGARPTRGGHGYYPCVAGRGAAWLAR
jgi:hypothetical protein